MKWQTEEVRSEWVEPEAFVIETIPFLKELGIESVVDLGCGVGRHSILFAQNGFKVNGIDASSSVISFVESIALEESLSITLQQSEMTDLPFENESIEYILAWNVIYHGDLSVVTRSFAEILRVLNQGDSFWEPFFQNVMGKLRLVPKFRKA